MHSQGAAKYGRSSMYKMYMEIIMLWFVWKEERKDQDTEYNLHN
jgi:hypothetical protein